MAPGMQVPSRQVPPQIWAVMGYSVWHPLVELWVAGDGTQAADQLA